MDGHGPRDEAAVARIERLGTLRDQMLAESEAVAARLRTLLDSIDRVQQALDGELESTPSPSPGHAPGRVLRTNRFRSGGSPLKADALTPPGAERVSITYPGGEDRPRGRALTLGGRFRVDAPAAGKTS